MRPSVLAVFMLMIVELGRLRHRQIGASSSPSAHCLNRALTAPHEQSLPSRHASSLHLTFGGLPSHQLIVA